MDKDKDFWMTVRAALIMFVKAIEKRYEIGAKGDYDMLSEKVDT